MREGYVIPDGEAVGLVGLSVHYKNSGMFVAHDVKAHAPLPASKRPREAGLPVVNDVLPAARFPNLDRELAPVSTGHPA
jgi:hypothetical protein